MITRHPTQTHMSVQRRTVDPEQALDWLETANTNNRKVSDPYVHRLARDMRSGQWAVTHHGIAFGPDGTLLDGQHRLWAVVEAGVPVEMVVWWNVDASAMMYIDCGKSRSTADILNIAGENGEVSNYHLAALRAMLGGLGNAPVLSPSETSAMLRRHREAIAFALEHLPKSRSARGITTAITRGIVARAYYSVDPPLLRDFCRKLVSGILTSADEAVIILLRQYLQAQRSNAYSVRMQTYAKVERALRAWLNDENPRRLYGVCREQFPLPEEARA